MTLKQAIEKFNAERRNNLSVQMKTDWLSHLDSVIFEEIISTHDNPKGITFSPYSSNTPEKTVLLVPDPYSDIYLRYLSMKADLYYSDITRYNNDLILYSAAYTDFENYYNRTYMPLKKTEFFNA